MKASIPLTGCITLSFTGGDILRTLDELSAAGISVLHCQYISELEMVITIRWKDYEKVKTIADRRGDSIRAAGRSGLYWLLKTLGKRPVLLVGAIMLLAVSMWLPSRVLFVRVAGNTSVPSAYILEAAEEIGISFGASRRDVRSEQIKNALLEAVPELQWAGVNTIGCVAEIAVRERAMEELPKPDSGFGHVIAGMDGFILSATVTRGSLLCVPGQSVAAGDVLISGYTDCGLSIRAEQAQGEIFAATRRNLGLVAPASGIAVVQTEDANRKISLLIGKKRINLWKDSGIWDTTCDRMYEEYYITLPGGFRLPFGLCLERYQSRRETQTTVNPEQTKTRMTDLAEDYLKGQMVSGAIRDSHVSFTEQEGIIQMTGEYSCVEMIGFRQRLEIGEENGESN